MKLMMPTKLTMMEAVREHTTMALSRARSTGTPNPLAVCSPLIRAFRFQRLRLKKPSAASVTPAIIATSRQEVRPRSPKVQKTTAATFTSSAKY